MLKFNEHILLVLRWLQNKNTVSKVELKNNSDSAREVYRTAADAAAAYDVAHFAHFARYAARAADADAKAAARAANAAREVYHAALDVADAEIWLNETKEHLNEYFKLTKEDRGTYEERASYLNVLGASNEKV